MSKRSTLSRLEDLRRGFVDVGRYRYILHKIDMEPWRDQTCPVCNQGFTKAPNFYMDSYAIHNDCSFTPAYDKWVAKLNDELYGDDDLVTDSYQYESVDDAYNTYVKEHGEF